VDKKDEKKILRKQVLEKVAELTLPEKVVASERVTEALLLLESVERSASIMIYAARTDEVDTFELVDTFLKQRKSVWLPWCSEDSTIITPVRITSREDLARGAFGILAPPEPVDKAIPGHFNPEIVIVPGVAFDTKGNRLGRGFGYYDRFLSTLPPNVETIGLAFECQMVSVIPVSETDVPLQRVLSS
jgi:5-formyltetrahydrofolate cyclo-ligase